MKHRFMITGANLAAVLVLKLKDESKRLPIGQLSKL